MPKRYVILALAASCVCGFLPAIPAYAQAKPSIPTVVVSPSSVVSEGTKVTVTVKAIPVDPKDVLVYQLWATNGTFSEFRPLFPQSAASYLPPPFTPGPGLIRFSSPSWNTWLDADGVFTFTADAPPGKYDLGCGATVSSGPNKQGHARSGFTITITPSIDAPDDAMVKIEDPRFDFDIVIATDAIPSEVYAARELRKFFAEATGVRLPIVTKTDRPGRHIFIGPSESLRQSNVAFSVDKMGDEDLRIIIRDSNIAIAGGRPRGTLYGVYTFLEDYLDVRFLTHDHTYVPPLGAWPLEGPVDVFYHPPLEFRECTYAETYRKCVFAARLRCNTFPRHPTFGGVTARTCINHSFARQLPTKVYGKAHPEYFALVGGKRKAQVPGNQDWRYSQPCLTNRDVLRVVTESVLAQIKANPKLTNVSVSQNDNHNYCRCPKCAAIDKREGTPMGSLLTFVNAVADEVAKKYPNVKVGTLAYAYSRKAPKTLKPRPNVQIQLCSLDVSVTKPMADPSSKCSEVFRRDLQAWGRICDDICIWYYNVNFYDYHLPNPNLRVLEPNIRFFVANGVRGVRMQAASTSLGTEFSDLRNYVTSRLLWNPKLSGQQLIDEFLTLHYGKAAEPIRRHINLFYKHVAAKGIDVPFDAKWKQLQYNKSLAKASLEAFEQATRLADNDVILRRVEKASICAYRMAIEDAYTWDDKKGPLPPGIAQRTRPYVKRIFELCYKYGITNMTEGLTIDKRPDPNRPFPGYRSIFRKRFGLKEGQSF